MPPGRGAGTAVSAPAVPSARTPTWKASSGTADSAAAAAGGGPGGRAGRRARGLAGERRRGRRLRGAADSSTDSGGGGCAAPPVVHRAAAPPLPRAGRAGGAVLPAPRPRFPLAAQAGVAPRAADAPAARPPRRHPSPRRRESLGPGSQSLRRTGFHRLGSPPRPAPVGTPGVQR